MVVTHVDPERAAQAREYIERFPPDPSQRYGLWNVVRTGQSELYERISDELLALGAQSPEHLALLRGVGMQSLVIVPISIRDRDCGRSRAGAAGDLESALERNQVHG